MQNHKNAVGLWNFKFPYLRKLDIVWGKDRATGLGAEDIAEASANPNCPKNMAICSSSDSEEELVVISEAQGSPASSSSSLTSKRRKKLSPRRESFHKQKKPTTLQATIETRLDNFTTKFESICDVMASQYAAATNAFIGEPKSESLTNEKMQEVINELLNVGISQMDVGRAAEICYHDHAKIEVFFALPSLMRRSYVLGFLYPSSNP